MSYVDNPRIVRLVKDTLIEDIGKGDITTRYFVPRKINSGAVIIARERGIACGINIAGLVFKCADKRIRFLPAVKEGGRITKGKILARLWGPAGRILSAERTALNFLGLLCGIATRTDKFVRMTGRYKVKILDTRKTIPGLRELEKYAVRIGKGYNHRFTLGEMAIIKDNHIKIRDKLADGDIGGVIKKLRKKTRGKIKIEVEVKNFKEFRRAVEAGPDIIMLDNMAPREVARAVKFQKKYASRRVRQIKTEVSGNINIANIRSYAACGIDFISLGTLTKDIQSLDIALELTGSNLNWRKR